MPMTLDDLRRFAVARTFFTPTTLKRAIQRMGFVQADPIRAPARAQDLTLRHRLVPVRPIGVLEAKQTQEGKTMRNDRLIGVAAESRAYREILAFKILGRFGPARARQLVRAGERRFQSESEAS